MVKQTQTIRWQEPTNCLNVFDHFVRLAPKGLKVTCISIFVCLLVFTSKTTDQTQEIEKRLSKLILSKTIIKSKEPVLQNSATAKS